MESAGLLRVFGGRLVLELARQRVDCVKIEDGNAVGCYATGEAHGELLQADDHFVTDDAAEINKFIVQFLIVDSLEPAHHARNVPVFAVHLNQHGVEHDVFLATVIIASAASVRLDLYQPKFRS